MTQDARQFDSEGTDPELGWSWIVRASWDGAVGIYWVQSVDGAEIKSMVEGPVSKAWTIAEDLVSALGAQGSRYFHVVALGGSFPPNRDWQPPITVRRGPFASSTDQSVLATVERELRRATGTMAYEADSAPEA